MKKTTPQKLSIRVTKYSALSLAIAGIADVSGQIIYTDVNPDLNINGGVYLLDMDNDGTGIDPTIIESGDADEFLFNQPDNQAFVAPYSSDAILGIDNGNFQYPFALYSGDTISSAINSWLLPNGFFKTMNWNSCNYSSSQWCGLTDKFLGLRFNIGGETHYGWARLDVALSPAASGITIKDYAYNSVPESAGVGHEIMAGQGIPLGLDDYALSKIKIVALNKSIALFNLPQHTNYRLFNLTGQSVLNGKITNNTHVIEAKTLATGVYILELKDNDSNAVIRKKIVL